MTADEELNCQIANIQTADDYWDAFGEVIERYPIGAQLYKSQINETVPPLATTIVRLLRELKEALELESRRSQLVQKDASTPNELHSLPSIPSHVGSSLAVDQP